MSVRFPPERRGGYTPGSLLLSEWRNQDEPLVDALAEGRRLDSQEQARRVADTFLEVLDRKL